MATTVKRETMAEQILEMIDTETERAMIIKDTPSAAPLSFTGDVPYFHTDLHKVATPDQKDPAAEPMVLAKLKEMRLKLSKLKAPMPYTRRRIDADEIWFIHKGKAKILTELGGFDAPAGRIVFIGRGVGYRVIPEGKDFMAYILESNETVGRTKSWELGELTPIYPDFPPPLPKANGQTEWEERLVTRSWSASAIRTYDPLKTKQLIGKTDLAFAVDVKDVPASSPKVTSGAPFELFSSPVLAWDVSKRTDPLPFYHRNTRRNEIYFVHLGGGDQDTDLGYLTANAGSFYNLPKGIEHSPMNRQDPLVILIMETDGDVEVNPAILGK